MALKKGDLATLTSYSLHRVNPRREYVNDTSIYTTVRYDLEARSTSERVRIAKVQRDGTTWYTPLSAEASGLHPQYRVDSTQQITPV